MFQHYMVTAFRNFVRHRLYTFINIVGLSVGLTTAILIFLFLKDELSYDRWIEHSENLFRVEVAFHMSGRDPMQTAYAPFPVLRAMQDHIPEVKAVTHVIPERMTVSTGGQQFPETVTVVDPNFFSVIRLPLAQGDAVNVLAQPESAVISQSTARKYFGSGDPVGKTLTLSAAEGWSCDPADTACLSAVHQVKVTGVLKDLPHNTQLIADLVLPNTSRADEVSPERKESAWMSTDGGYGYVELVPNADPDAVLSKLAAIVDQSVHPERIGQHMRGSEMEPFRLTRFSDAHLTSDNDGGMRPPGSRTTVYGFAIVGLMILIVACFNFMNLATARALLRAREIGLRKVVGAKRQQLVIQFLGEAVITALISMLIAIAMAEILLPLYATFLNRPLHLDLTDGSLVSIILISTVSAGLLSGIYPALVLSAFRPAAVLKSGRVAEGGAGRIRAVLVVSQFAVSIGLGIITIVVYSQIEFARHINLGFARDGVVVLGGMTKLTPSARESFVRALKANPQIVGASLSNAVPFYLLNTSNVPVAVEGDPTGVTAHIFSVGSDFASLYGLRLLAGRLLSPAYAEDISPERAGHNVMINEEAARRLGLNPEQAVGKTIKIGNDPLTVVGVLADALFDGLKGPVVPTLYLHDPASDTNTLMSIRIRGGDFDDALAFIDKTWRAFAPNTAIQRYFLNDRFDGLFEADERQGAMFATFVAVAIVIACLGLFGLAAFLAARRTKEVGIRKVCGARTVDVVRLLLWQMSIPVLIANIIAWPISYYYLQHWMEGYNYRISLQPLYFVLPGLIALFVAWGTVLSHSLRLARSSPVRALRYE